MHCHGNQIFFVWSVVEPMQCTTSDDMPVQQIRLFSSIVSYHTRSKEIPIDLRELTLSAFKVGFKDFCRWELKAMRSEPARSYARRF